MSKAQSNLDLPAILGNLSAYRRRGSDKLILRRPGGFSKKQFLNDPGLEATRNNLSDFGGCNKMTNAFRHAISPLLRLGDPNFTGALNQLFRMIQRKPSGTLRGVKSILLSQNRGMVSGFTLNRDRPFEGILRDYIPVEVNREQLTVTIALPALSPGINLRIPWEAPYYRIILSLGIAGDIIYGEKGFESTYSGPGYGRLAQTEWCHQEADAGPTQLSVQLTGQVIPDSASLIVGIGIEMGMPDKYGEIVHVKYAGSAKVLEVF